MNIALAQNPSRGTWWWEAMTEAGAVLLLGPVRESKAQAEADAENVRKAIAQAKARAQHTITLFRRGGSWWSHDTDPRTAQVLGCAEFPTAWLAGTAEYVVRHQIQLRNPGKRVVVQDVPVKEVVSS